MIFNNCDRMDVIQAVIRQNKLLELNKGAEVGVRFGETAEHLLTLNKHLTLLLVDPYLPYLDVNDYQYTEEEQSKIKKEAANRLKKFNYRAKWIYKPSVEAVNEVEDSSLDFVYIDGEHTYEACTSDIYAWYTTVRPKGLLIFHDISMTPVRKAVDEWVAKFGKTLICSDKNSDIGMIEI